MKTTKGTKKTAKETKADKETNYIRFDWAIKRMLRNKADFGAVNGLLSCLFGKQIFITNVLESEGNQEEEDSKFNRVDVLVEDESGEKIIIEIQNNYQVDYYHRMLFGVSKVVCGYLKKGDNYDKINKIYSVSIVYFELGQGNDYIYFSETEFRGKHTGDILKLTPTQRRKYKREKVGDIFPLYCLLRVENFDEIAITPIAEWVHYLKTTEVPEHFTAQGLSEIREKQRVEDLPEAEQKAYYRHLDQVNYEEGVIEHQRSEGRIEGEKIGLAKGLAEGEQERLKLEKFLSEKDQSLAEKDQRIAELERQLKTKETL
jgi:hypothetical protein